jgi:hypothetical protein
VRAAGVLVSRVTLHAQVVVGFALAVVVGCGGKEASVGPGETADQAPVDPGDPPNGGAPARASDDARDAGGIAMDGGRHADAAAEGGEPGAPTVGVTCGTSSCAAPAFCHICDPITPASARSCETDPAKSCSPRGDYPPLRVSCDGQEDCKANERCVLFEGSVGTYVRCMPEGNFGSIVCRSPADCAPHAKTCEAYATPGYAVRVCN